MTEREKTILETLETIEAYAADLIDMVAVQRESIFAAVTSPNGAEILTESNICIKIGDVPTVKKGV